MIVIVIVFATVTRVVLVCGSLPLFATVLLCHWAGAMFTKISIRSPSDEGLFSSPEKFLSNPLISLSLVEHVKMIILTSLCSLLRR